MTRNWVHSPGMLISRHMRADMQAHAHLQRDLQTPLYTYVRIYVCVRTSACLWSFSLMCVCVCVYGCYTCMRLDADCQMNAVCIFFSCMQRNGSVCPRVHMDTHTPLSCTHASRAHSRVHVQVLTAQDTFVKTLFRALVTALVFLG